MTPFSQFLANLNGGQRAEALYAYFGWQGGTVHQLTAATGISVGDILYGAMDGHDTGLAGDYSSGWSAIRTCETKWRKETLAPRYQGNVAYWHGVIAGHWLEAFHKAA